MPLNLDTPLPKVSQTNCCFSLYEWSISHFVVLIFCTSVEVCVHVGTVCMHDSHIVTQASLGLGHPFQSVFSDSFDSLNLCDGT